MDDRALDAQLLAEGIVLDTGWVRMTFRRSRRRTNAPNRLVLTHSRLQLVTARTCDTPCAEFGRLRVWHTGDILQIEIATDPRNDRVQVDAIWVKVAEPSRWVSELASRGAIVAPIHDTGRL